MGLPRLQGSRWHKRAQATFEFSEVIEEGLRGRAPCFAAA